jgi:hypothetical protein
MASDLLTPMDYAKLKTTSRVGLTSNANLLTEQGGASARKDVAEPANKRDLSHSVSLLTCLR